MEAAARAALGAEAARLQAEFAAAGAVPVEVDLLQPADLLLDLYGEDIRARAYVTHDPVRGELMLRPDFTVPVVQAHMAEGAEPARYTYAGPVFRMQEAATGRPSEFLQVGYEVFDGSDPAAVDAEVFALFARILAPLRLNPATGDIGILMAAVAGLSTSQARRRALMRHIWRPQRFRALLDRFGGRAPTPPARRALLEAARQRPAAELIAGAGQLVGLREEAEIAARLALLQEEAETPPLDPGEMHLLEEILALRGSAAEALAALGPLARRMPALEPAVARLAARLAALAARGIAPEGLPFEAGFGRTTLEYYDGFVFGFAAPGREMPPVASGGRYDALTRVLGRGRGIPAVGGVIRPEQVLALAEGGR
jgi:ATP phosphoribosyltransferase regulatory subunit